MRLFPIITPAIANLSKLDAEVVRRASARGISLVSFEGCSLFFDPMDLWHYTFYCEFGPEEYLLVSKHTNLNLRYLGPGVDDDSAFLFSGTLRQWLDTIYDVCCPATQNSRLLRFIFNKINNWFEQQGIRCFTKVDLKDTTYEAQWSPSK